MAKRKKKELTEWQIAIKAHRKVLIKQHGYPKTNLDAWQYRGVKPRYETAEALSLILGLPVSRIPYVKTEINEPRR